MSKPKIYIASPYTIGDVALNVRRQIETANELLELGFIPHIPLLSHFWHMVTPKDYAAWLEIDLEWLKVCDAVLRLGGESEGADIEAEKAFELGIPVFYSIQKLSEVFNEKQR